MKIKQHCIILTILSVLSFGPVYADEPRIEAYQSAFHVDKTVMACGKVVEVKMNAKLTYLNLDKPFPDQTLGLLIWEDKIPEFETKFGNLSTLQNQRVCARGKITEYKDSLQMKLTNPQFLRLMK